VPYPATTTVSKILAHREQRLPSIRKARPDVPAELARVLPRLIAKKPADRYQTPAEVAAALAPFAEPPSQTDKRGSKRGWLIAAASLFFGLLLAAGVVVYRIQTDQGELVIRTESDDVEVVVKQGGQLVEIIDVKTKKKITLRSGVYDLELKGGQGLKLDITHATLKRGDVTLASIERVAAKAEAKKGPDVVMRPPVEKVGQVGLFVGHRGSVGAVAYSPDGRFVLSGGGYPNGDGTIRLWDVATGVERLRFGPTPSWVGALAFSPDGCQVLSGQVQYKPMILWDTATGKQIRRFDVGSWNCSVAFSPDGRRASGGDTTPVRVWDTDTGNATQLFVVPTKPHVYHCVAFSPDEKWAFTGVSNGTISRWNVETGQRVQSFGGGAIQLTVSSVGSLLLSSQQTENVLRVWDWRTGKQACELSGHVKGVLCQALSRDGRRALSGSLDCTLRLWDVESGAELSRFNHDGNVCCFWLRGRHRPPVAPARPSAGQRNQGAGKGRRGAAIHGASGNGAQCCLLSRRSLRLVREWLAQNGRDNPALGRCHRHGNPPIQGPICKRGRSCILLGRVARRVERNRWWDDPVGRVNRQSGSSL
jgi:WD40 repeat protein